MEIIDLLDIKLHAVDFLLEKLQLENDKLKAEVEKWQMTTTYWYKKYENRFVGNVMKVITEEPKRSKIGFCKTGFQPVIRHIFQYFYNIFKFCVNSEHSFIEKL